MSEELLDLVDLNDEVVGTTTKIKAHSGTGDPHRIAAVFVFLGDKLLIQKHTKEKGGDMDHSVGGHIAKGESYEEAAKREMKEELGLDIPFSFVGKVLEDATPYDRPNRSYDFIHWQGVFEAHISEEQFKSLKPDPREVAEIIPKTIEEIAEWMRKEPQKFTIGFLHTLNFYIKEKNLDIPEIPIA